MKKKDRGMGVSRDLELLEARSHSFGKTGVVEVRCPSGISVLRVKDAQGPTTWKGIELIPVGTKVELFNKEWVITAHCHSYYALKFEGLGYTGKTTVAFKSTESLRKSIRP